MQMQILITSMLQVSVVCSHLVSIHHANVRMRTVQLDLDLTLVCENPVVSYEHINVLWSVLRFLQVISCSALSYSGLFKEFIFGYFEDAFLLKNKFLVTVFL